MGSPERELCPPPSEEDELTLPRASINKMIKELVPSIRVAFESRELILNCCTEFIHLISSEANEVCNQSNKKTINAEHVLTGKCSNSNKHLLDFLNRVTYHVSCNVKTFYTCEKTAENLLINYDNVKNLFSFRQIRI